MRSPLLAFEALDFVEQRLRAGDAASTGAGCEILGELFSTGTPRPKDDSQKDSEADKSTQEKPADDIWVMPPDIGAQSMKNHQHDWNPNETTSDAELIAPKTSAQQREQLYGVMMIIFAARDLYLIKDFDYAAPVLVLQKQIAELRRWHLRAGLWHRGGQIESLLSE